MANHRSRGREIRHTIESVEAQLKSRRSRLEKLEDRVVSVFGTIEFLILNLAAFAGWIAWNSGWIPGLEPFDPYPYVLLITTVSLEAIVLAIFVLITQNRQERIASLREELGLQVDLIAEQESTKILKTLAIILKKMGVDPSEDPELQKMLAPLNPGEIEHQLEEQLK